MIRFRCRYYDMTDMELKQYGDQLSYMTFDFNMDHDLDIKPIAKSESHFEKWVTNYSFYLSVFLYQEDKKMTEWEKRRMVIYTMQTMTRRL